MSWNIYGIGCLLFFVFVIWLVRGDDLVVVVCVVCVWFCEFFCVGELLWVGGGMGLIYYFVGLW